MLDAHTWGVVAARSAALAASFALPFLALNAVVASRIEPLFSLIRPDAHTSALEYALLATVLLLMPLGAFVALRRERLYAANVAVAVVLLGLFLAVATAPGVEIYRCDVLRIPNCD